jgi:hypothetical protein
MKILSIILYIKRVSVKLKTQDARPYAIDKFFDLFVIMHDAAML